MKKNNKNWYSIIVSLIIIWLLLVLSTWTLTIVLFEMKDNRGMWDSIKAFAWAEASQELALLAIKENGYGYYEKVENNINNKSIILSEHPLDIDLFNKNNDVLMSYDIASKTDDYRWVLSPLWYDIIPLFYIDDDWEHKINNYSINIIAGDLNSLIWNIIWINSWISWKWNNTIWVMKKVTITNELDYSEININDFLTNSESNYLILFNTLASDNIEYEINSIDWNYFSKPKSNIITSAQIWKYKQNLDTFLDNTKFLDRQKYVIYSN